MPLGIRLSQSGPILRGNYRQEKNSISQDWSSRPLRWTFFIKNFGIHMDTLLFTRPFTNKDNGKDNDKDNDKNDDDDNGKASVWQRTQWPDTFPLPPGGDKFSPNQVSPSRHHRRRDQHLQHTL